MPRQSLRPARSSFGTVDPAPASAVSGLAELEKVLLDPEHPMFERYQCLFALRARNDDAAAKLIGNAMVVDRSALLRHECAYVLGQMQRTISIPWLVRSLANDPNPMVRHEAAEALGAIGSDEVLEPLRRGLAEDPSGDVRESCQLALSHFEYLRDNTRF